MTWRTSRSTILQNFIALSQPTPEIPVTKILGTKNKQKTSTAVNPNGVYPRMPIALTGPFVTLTFNLSRSSKVKLMGPTSYLLPFVAYFTSKSMTLIFDPSRLSKVKSDGANRKHMASFKKVLPGVEPRIYHRFQDVSNERIVTLTYSLSRSCKVKTMGSLYNLRWVRHRNCCRCWYISRKKYDLDFWPLMVIQGQRWRCQSKVRWSYMLVLPGSSLISVTVFEIFESKFCLFTFWPWSC